MQQWEQAAANRGKCCSTLILLVCLQIQARSHDAV